MTTSYSSASFEAASKFQITPKALGGKAALTVCSSSNDSDGGMLLGTKHGGEETEGQFQGFSQYSNAQSFIRPIEQTIPVRISSPIDSMNVLKTQFLIQEQSIQAYWKEFRSTCSHWSLAS
ncbi:hypothetical protein PGT21_000767 [Puccinia graminis f. sp. tritici]|uniref:Uncharacterized protein n=1 Tax=Puccinia graminis f. sp. tritici TaxID=56615 RepID=A0A5B0N8C0_PUCGR|nr:hypothetical protein PGT21_000781 [Puccinia graminis f. sp. tritici]KAA1084976.1 hypothetical protein PGT21_000767 [Puccinia graminis f. sp. tritici]KAA1118315.1 hypothetical protein PGTUg99_002719 [Puccinia graminis f. sp. tritici]